MIDALAAMARKRDLLLCERRRLKNEYEAKTNEIDRQLEIVERAFAAIDEALSDRMCPGCGGDGILMSKEAREKP